MKLYKYNHKNEILLPQYTIILSSIKYIVNIISYNYANANYTHHIIMIMTKKRMLYCNNLMIAHRNDFENTKKECKERCDKEIQKIILKDKIEKELTEKLAALYRDIFTDDISTCICEKSLADKVERTCLRCEGILVGGVEPTVGFLGIVVVNQLTKATTVASIAAANKCVLKLLLIN
ncbi:surface antigen [Plasmodium falciparum UGT5.1]|uniref:Surface antigen n=1 Tax=Plasmodium falciparum UGT5.1 TaxID=1237627 RepID=W7JUH2_PLAFA|nr:surface antigen [Plasmodium falciparum UGT5.1]